MASRTVHAVSSKHFIFNKTDKCFTTEVSMLPRRYNFKQPLYTDDCRTFGFSIMSEKTGTTVRYYLGHIDENEGDTMGWYFKPTPESERDVPACIGTSVLIIND